MKPTSDAQARREMTEIARLYYEQGLTHQQIAGELGLSRVKVTRLLAQARADGIVEITINGADEPFADLADQLAARFGLERAWVAPTGVEGDHSRVLELGAHCLRHHLQDARVVAVGLSSTLAGVGLRLERVEGAATSPSFVPMAGGWGGWQQGLNPGELAATLAAQFDGRAYGFPAPLLAPSAAFARVVGELPEVGDALRMAASADTILFSVGGLDWSTSPLQGSIGQVEREELVRRGAVGDVSARFFDCRGMPVESSVDERAIGMTLAELRAVPRRILLGHGVRKHEALVAALSSGMATVLCTDSETARRLVSSAGHPNREFV